MKYLHFISDLYNAEAQVSRFAVYEKPTEYHAMFQLTRKNMTFTEQLEHLQGAIKEFNSTRIPQAKVVFVRYFLSDVVNQFELLQQTLNNTQCAVSVVEQAPLSGTKVAIWCIFQTDVEIESSADAYIVKHNGYSHIWNTYLHNSATTPEEQTKRLLTDYIETLRKHNVSLLDNCMRTWFFVRNIDVNYGDVVKGRCEIFDREGLTEQTHYIASTGIEGKQVDQKCFVSLDAYALKGVKNEQIQYLLAKDNLSSTREYGVTFERGTAIHYGDRKVVFVSGTASIDNKGEILYQGDVSKQADRMLDNVNALLSEAGVSTTHLASVIIYLRDNADYATIRAWADYRLPDVPKAFVSAPVCRKGWLVEMECIAIAPENNPQYPDF